MLPFSRSRFELVVRRAPEQDALERPPSRTGQLRGGFLGLFRRARRRADRDSNNEDGRDTSRDRHRARPRHTPVAGLRTMPWTGQHREALHLSHHEPRTGNRRDSHGNRDHLRPTTVDSPPNDRRDIQPRTRTAFPHVYDSRPFRTPAPEYDVEPHTPPNRPYNHQHPIHPTLSTNPATYRDSQPATMRSDAALAAHLQAQEHDWFAAYIQAQLDAGDLEVLQLDIFRSVATPGNVRRGGSRSEPTVPAHRGRHREDGNPTNRTDETRNDLPYNADAPRIRRRSYSPPLGEIPDPDTADYTVHTDTSRGSTDLGSIPEREQAVLR